MIKKVLLVAAAVFGVLMVVAGYALYNLNSIIAAYKSQIESIASDTLKARVSLGEIQASIFPAASLIASDLRIRPTHAPADEHGIALGSLVIRVSMLPLLSGELDVNELTLQKPSVTIIKDAHGTTIAGLSSSPEQDQRSKTDTSSKTSTEAKTSSASLAEKIQLNLDKVTISNAAFTFNDQTKNSSFKVENVGLDINGIKYDLQNGTLTWQSANLSLLGNTLRLDGVFNTKDKTGKFNISSAGIKLDNLSALLASTPALAKLGLRGTIVPALTFEPDQNQGFKAAGKVTALNIALQANQLSISEASGDLNLQATQSEQKLSSSGFKLKFADQPLQFSIDALLRGQELAVKPLDISAFEGQIHIPLSYNTASQDFSTTLDIRDLAIEKTLSALAPSASGKLRGGVLEKISGNLAGKAAAYIPGSLHGNLSLALRDAALPGLNLSKAVLEKISLPFLSGVLLGAAPPELAAEISADVTPLKSLTATMRIADGSINTPDLKLVSSLFSLNADGRVGFDLSTTLNATILFSPSFSAALAARVKELKSILDRDGRLVVPLSISGTLPKVMVVPDLSKLAKLGAENLLHDKATDLIGKALGGKQGSSKGKGLGDLLGF